MNAFEKRELLRRAKPKPDVQFRPDVAKELCDSLARQRRNAERERAEASKSKHLPLSTPVRPWEKNEGGSRVTAIYPGDQSKAREARQRRAAERMLQTGE